MPEPVAASLSRAPRELPDLRALEAFVAVCEAGSMMLAGRRMGISQSAVSQLVKALEQDFGTVLFDRDLRPARPTRSGRELLELARDLLAEARGLAARMRASADWHPSQLRLGCVDSFAATVGPALIRGLSGTARDIRMWSGLAPALGEQLRSRELDFAICNDTGDIGPRIHQRFLFSEAWVAVFPRGSAVPPVAQPARLVDLVPDLPLIRYSRRSHIGRQIERYLGHVGIKAPHRFEFDATDPMLSLVAAGLGWALSTPLCLWQSRAYLDDVTVMALPAARLDRRDFFLLTHESESDGVGQEIARLVRQILRHETAPDIARRVPGLRFDFVFEAGDAQ